MRYALTLATLLCIFLLAPATAAPFGGPSNDALLVAADGSDQLRQIRDLLDAHAAGVRPLDAQIRTLRAQITDLLTSSEPVDSAEIAALAQQIFTLRKERDIADMVYMVELHALLSPAALKRLAPDEPPVLPNQALAALPEPDDLFGDPLGYGRGVALAPAQWDRIHAVIDANAGSLRLLDLWSRSIRVQAAKLLTKRGRITAAQLLPLQQLVSGLQDQIDGERLAMTLKIRNLLTPAQRAKAALLHQRLVAPRAQQAALPVEVRRAND